MELQAQLYRTQEHVRSRQAGEAVDKHVARRGPMDLLKGSNAGVHARSEKDRLAIKGTPDDPDRESEVRAALERKAALYEKLARGEVEDGGDRYEVDFFVKVSANNVLMQMI